MQKFCLRFDLIGFLKVTVGFNEMRENHIGNVNHQHTPLMFRVSQRVSVRPSDASRADRRYILSILLES